MKDPISNQRRRPGYTKLALVPPHLSLLLSLFVLWDRGGLLALSWVIASLSWSLIGLSHYWSTKIRISRLIGYASVVSAIIAILVFMAMFFR